MCAKTTPHAHAPSATLLARLNSQAVARAPERVCCCLNSSFHRASSSFGTRRVLGSNYKWMSSEVCASLTAVRGVRGGDAASAQRAHCMQWPRESGYSTLCVSCNSSCTSTMSALTTQSCQPVGRFWLPSAHSTCLPVFLPTYDTTHQHQQQHVQERAVARSLISNGQGYIFKAWPQPGR